MNGREFELVMTELRTLRTDLGGRLDAVNSALADKPDRAELAVLASAVAAKADQADHDALDSRVDVLRTSWARWRGVLATVSALWAALTTGLGLWFTAKGAP
jgi:hypothetical protein